MVFNIIADIPDEDIPILNNELIKREDKSYNEYIKEQFNGAIKK